MRCGHPFVCNDRDCKEGFYSDLDRIRHETSHLTEHGRIELTFPSSCPECTMIFYYEFQVNRHAHRHRHATYMCKCGLAFARVDTLNRHLDKYSSGLPRYPCSHCNRHKGSKGFRRKDHLKQHLQNYHHIDQEYIPRRPGYNIRDIYQGCPYFRCPQYLDRSLYGEMQGMFESLAEFNNHMRGVHDETPFPCGLSGCPKTNGKGYLRERDLINHRKKMHPEAPQYIALGLRYRFPCKVLDCPYDPTWTMFDLAEHYQDKHAYTWEAAHKMSRS